VVLAGAGLAAAVVVKVVPRGFALGAVLLGTLFVRREEKKGELVNVIEGSDGRRKREESESPTAEVHKVE